MVFYDNVKDESLIGEVRDGGGGSGRGRGRGKGEFGVNLPEVTFTHGRSTPP